MIIANVALKKIITSEGILIYLPNTPEVLIKNVAMIKPRSFSK